MLEAPATDSASGNAMQIPTDRQSIWRKSTDTEAAMTIPQKIETAFSPPLRKSAAKRTSDSHSHEYQGCSALPREKGSECGTERVSMMRSPLRMCHPVSPSASSTDQPCPVA